MLEVQKREERDNDLKVEEDIILSDNTGRHWKYVVEDNHEDKGGEVML